MDQREKRAAKKIGQMIRTRRKILKISQKELAKHLGSDQAAISRMENGLMLPTLLQWIDLCGLLGIPADQCLEYAKEK